MASSKGPQFGVLALRVLTFSFSLVALIILATNTVTVTDSVPVTVSASVFIEFGEFKYRFSDVLAYRYTFSIAVIGCVYALMQIPIAALSITKGKKIISKQVFPVFIFVDVVMGLVLASGVGAGFGATVDVKRFFDKCMRVGGLQATAFANDVDKALDLVQVSTGFILLAALCTAFAVLILTMALVKN